MEPPGTNTMSLFDPATRSHYSQLTLNLLKDSQDHSNQSQKDVQRKLDEWSKLPEFNYSLMCILSDPNACDEETRCLSCFVLKNNVKKHYQCFPNELKEFLKKSSLELLRDPKPMIRSTVGILIANIAACGELMTWTDLLPTLGQMLNANEVEIIESSFCALNRICEDLAEILTTDGLIDTLAAMLPRFLDFFKHPHPKIRNYALTCINQFIPIPTDPITNIMSKYVESLFLLANDTEPEIKKNVCRSIVTLFDQRPETLEPHLNLVIQYMFSRSKDDDADTALEACEFWLSIPEHEFGKNMLRQYLPQLIPFFMEKMRYSQEDIDMMMAEFEDDFMKPDKDDDIKPRHYKSKGQGNPRLNTSGDQDISDLEDTEFNADEDDDVGFDDDDDEGYDGSDSSWTVRKCTAAALDCFAHTYGDDILPYVFQELQKYLRHEDWVIKEAAVLAIGAISEGCLYGMVPHLPDLVPYLIEHLKDKHPFVRSITCWTISRYSRWIIQNPSERYFNLVIANVLSCILDGNKRVQEAACSSFAILAEGAEYELVPYLDQTLDTLVKAFDKYQHKNLMNLYDAVGTLAQSVKHYLNRPQYIKILMPPIIKRWNVLSDTDQDLFPLFECLSSISVALCDGFQPYAEAVFRRCLVIVEQNLQQVMAFNADPENTDMPNKDFIIAALDLLSGLAEGLNKSITDLVGSSNVVQLTYQCMLDSLPEVRQSSFALIGDLTKACFQFVKPHVPQIMDPLARNLNYEYLSVCNNATWAVGEIASQLGPEMRVYVGVVLPQLLSNINQNNIQRTVLDNITIAIGRLAFACPDDVAPSINTFIKPWCSSIRQIRDNDVKDSAFRGICELIRRNPNGVVNEFYYLCDAIACYNEPKADLKQNFYQILNSFKEQVGPEHWTQFTQTFPPDVKDKLSSVYGV